MDRIMGFFDAPMLISMAMQWVNTAILCAILAKILYNPVKNFLKNRAERIQKQISDAASDYKEAKSIKTDYEKKLKEIDKERTEILEKARAQAVSKSDQIINEAKREAEAIKNRAALDIQREMENSKDEVRQQMIEISSLMASRYITTTIDKKTQNRLLEEAIADLGDAKWLN